MKSYLKQSFLPLVAAISIIAAFQNCSTNNLPDASLQNSTGTGSNSSNSSNLSGTSDGASALTPCIKFLTSGSTWTVPSDWNSGANMIEVIGSGADGGGNVRGGGGGGAYSRSVNVTLVPGANIGYSITHFTMSYPLTGHSSGVDAGDTFLCNNTSNCTSLQDGAVVVGAAGGNGSTNGPVQGIGGSNIDSIGGTGGSASIGVAMGTGSVKYSGGDGGNCLNLNCNYDPSAQPGSGGGAAGPHGNGSPGGAGAGMGGAADAGYGGAGGNINQAGNNGHEWDATHGAGGGGGGSAAYTPGSAGGNYGGGGGGGGNDNFGANPAADGSGVGGGGLIVISYLGTICQ